MWITWVRFRFDQKLQETSNSVKHLVICLLHRVPRSSFWIFLELLKVLKTARVEESRPDLRIQAHVIG